MKCARFFESQKIVHISNPNKSEIDAKLDYFQKNPTIYQSNVLCDHAIQEQRVTAGKCLYFLNMCLFKEVAKKVFLKLVGFF